MNQPIFSALNTLKAGRLELFFAKLFGVKRTVRDSDCTVTMHYWRGTYYLTGMKKD